MSGKTPLKKRVSGGKTKCKDLVRNPRATTHRAVAKFITNELLIPVDFSLQTGQF